MRHKKSLITVFVVFVALTTFVYCASSTTTTKRVKFKNQGIAINQGTAHIRNERIGVNIANTNSGFQNQDINADNQNLNIGDNGMGISNANTNINNQGFENQNTNINNQGGINNSNINYSNSNNINSQGNRYNNISGDYSNTRNINNQTNSFGNNSGGFGNTNNAGGSSNEFGNSSIVMSNQNYPRNYEGAYQNVDWSTWKSNFVNRFLDDSLFIPSLDLYGVGTWFYYSFNVSNKGEISNIKVFSLYLSKEDKDKIRELIQSYEYQPITIFPSNTKREKAKVKAIVLLGDSESKSRPSDFNDTERIKIQY